MESLQGIKSTLNDDSFLCQLFAGAALLGGYLTKSGLLTLAGLVLFVLPLGPGIIERLGHRVHEEGSVWSGRRRLTRSLGDFTLSSDDGEYEIDTFVIFAVVIAAFTEAWMATFIDTQPDLAAKAGFLLDEASISIGIIALFAVLVYIKYRESIYTFNPFPNLEAIAFGVIGMAGLILIQIVVFSFFPGDSLSAIKLSTGTIQVNTELGGIFYSDSAINETFLFQGVFYTIFVRLISGLDKSDEVSWFDHIVASALVAGMAGFLHYAVYSADAPAILAVIIGFAFLNFLYEVTDSLTTPMIAHLGLNVLSTVSGSIFTLSMLTPVGAVPGSLLIEIAVIAGATVAVAWFKVRRDSRDDFLPAPLRNAVREQAPNAFITRFSHYRLRLNLLLNKRVWTNGKGRPE